MVDYTEIGTIMSPAPGYNSEFTDYNEEGVDLTLIRAMLALTPAERLEMLDDMVNFVRETRRLNGIVELPEDTWDSCAA
jgi:hypothetical protein